jgi:hypothetical protein
MEARSSKLSKHRGMGSGNFSGNANSMCVSVYVCDPGSPDDAALAPTSA